MIRLPKEDEGLRKPFYQAVGIDRNDAAKPTERPGRRWRMYRLPFEVAKGHRGRPGTTF